MSVRLNEALEKHVNSFSVSGGDLIVALTDGAKPEHVMLATCKKTKKVRSPISSLRGSMYAD